MYSMSQAAVRKRKYREKKKQLNVKEEEEDVKRKPAGTNVKSSKQSSTTTAGLGYSKAVEAAAQVHAQVTALTSYLQQVPKDSKRHNKGMQKLSELAGLEESSSEEEED